MKSTNMNSLPDDIVRLILLNISIRALIHLRSVCAQWRVVIDEGICAGKQRLQLFSDTRLMRHWKDNLVQHELEERFELGEDCQNDYLILSSKKYKAIQSARPMITYLFPNVTNFTVYYDGLVQLDLIGLLRQWPNLVSLTIYGLSDLHELKNRQKATSFRTKLWSQINSLQLLERLNLYYINRLSFPPNGSIPVMNRLKRFTLFSYTGPDTADQILKNLGLNCTHLTLDWTYFQLIELKRLINEHNPKLAKTVTHLKADYFRGLSGDEWIQFYGFIAEKFVNLRSFQLSLPSECTLAKLSQIINKISYLEVLKVTVDSNSLVKPLNISSFFKSLPSVRTLQLDKFCLCVYQHQQNDGLSNIISLDSMFPNLKQLIIGSNCDECREKLYEFFRNEFQENVLVKICNRIVVWRNHSMGEIHNKNQ